MVENSRQEQQPIWQISEKIVGLILDGQYEQAAAMIEAASQDIPTDELHRLIALSGLLERETGNLHKGIDLLQEAKRGRPTWLPHLYRLAVFLMDAERWLDANLALDELISLAEKSDDRYFLDDARFRKIFCLKALGRGQEMGCTRFR